MTEDDLKTAETVARNIDHGKMTVIMLIAEVRRLRENAAGENSRCQKSMYLRMDAEDERDKLKEEISELLALLEDAEWHSPHTTDCEMKVGDRQESCTCWVLKARKKFNMR